MSESKKCPKCGGDMEKGRIDSVGGVHIIRKDGSAWRVGDKVFPYYCIKCGFVELYKMMKRKS